MATVTMVAQAADSVMVAVTLSNEAAVGAYVLKATVAAALLYMYGGLCAESDGSYCSTI
jgi:hypothetical protein